MFTSLAAAKNPPTEAKHKKLCACGSVRTKPRAKEGVPEEGHPFFYAGSAN